MRAPRHLRVPANLPLLLGTLMLAAPLPPVRALAAGSGQSVKIDFEGLGGSTGFSSGGSNWSGGLVHTLGIPKLYSSGAFAWLPDPGGASVSFDSPVTGVSFFFVHLSGGSPGNAMAFDANDMELGSVQSHAATSFGDPANFVTLAPGSEVSRITFSAGHIDDFQFTIGSGPEPPLVEPIALGDRVLGQLSPGGLHQFPFEAVAGTLLSVGAARHKGGSVSPALRVVGADETELFSFADSVVTDKRARVKKLLLPATGSYRLEIAGGGGTGGYKLSTRARFPKPAKETVAVHATGVTGSGIEPDEQLRLDALAGARLRRVVVSRLKPKGDFATIDGAPADLSPTFVSLAPADDPGNTLPLDVKTNKSGTRAVLGEVGLPATGTWVLEIGGANGSVGFAKAKAKLIQPKAKQLHQLP